MDFTLLLGTLIIVLASALTVLVALKRPFNTYIDILVIIICIVLVAYALQRSEEHFTDPGPSSNTTLNGSSTDNLGKMIDTIGKISGSNGRISGGGNGKNDEVLTSFASGLTLYYSAFSVSSYPQASRRWRNISPYESSSTSCPEVDAHIYFSDVPTFNRNDGFSLSRNKLIGPQSHRLGITANESFTIAFALSFDASTASSVSASASASASASVSAFTSSNSTPPPIPMSSAVEIIKLYANTIGNNGISLSMDTSTKMFFFGFGDKMNPLNLTGIPAIVPGNVYLFVIIKSGSGITVKVYPNVTDLSSNFQVNTVAAQLAIDNTTDVLLSNKEMRINGTSNAPAHIFNVAFWNKAVQDSTMADFYANLQAELQKNNETLKKLASQIATMKDQLNAGKRCPYDEATCAACQDVKDWSDISDVIMNAGPDCRAKIDSYCQANPSNAKCSCWNTSSLLYTTPQCSSYRSMFNGSGGGGGDGGKGCNNIDVAALDDDVLERIKGEFNLCSCPSNTIPMPAALNIASPRPNQLGAYSKNATDIDIYNSISS